MQIYGRAACSVAFSANMDWTGRQQILLAIQSAVLGLLLGLLFDGLNGVGRISKHPVRIWLDVVWGPVSALIIFFGSLIITHGQLHPVLLVGVAVGMLIEHYTMGIWLSRLVAFCGAFLRKSIGLILRTGRKLLRFVTYPIVCLLSFVKNKIKNKEKA